MASDTKTVSGRERQQRAWWGAWSHAGRTLTLGGLVLALTTVAMADPLPGSSPSLPDNPLKGRMLFESRGCNSCHGLVGDNLGIGPNLGERHFNGTFLELGAALWNHVPGMSVTFEVTGLPWPQLTSDEAMELIAFLYFIDYLGRPGVAAAGEAIFVTQGCSSCHSIGGGEANIGPDLAELRNFASPLDIAQQIWNHGPSMLEGMRRLDIPPPSFGDGDLADLSAFVRQKAGPGLRERTLLAPGNPNHGNDLFVSKGCSKCHGADGRGGDGGPDLRLTRLRLPAETIASTMWNHALGMRSTMQERGIGWPEFQDSELADLVAFLYFLPFSDVVGDSQRGGSVFRERSCNDCHAAGDSSRVEDGAPGPELSSTTATASSASMVAAMWNHAPVMKKAILGEGRPWPELTGQDMRDLRAFLMSQTAAR